MRGWLDLLWWRRRAARRGTRSVLNLGYPASELDAVTERQRRLLLPLLAGQLRGDERVVLDFGCGPGRFTAALAELVGGRAVGVDPTQRLLDLAPAHPDVEYRRIRRGCVPLEDASVDVVWICLVLLAITDERALAGAIREVGRVLRPEGLIVLIENTSPRPDRSHLRYRPAAEYQRLFPWAALAPIGGYDELGEPITVLAGRKQAP